jgi:NAD(P)-dependent dehydrogenase (short-subunit alcohol dehydrogenase family)
VRPLDQQVILVTGSTDGLGRNLARELAARGATVLLHGRGEKRVRDTLAEIRDATRNDTLGSYVADLAGLANVRRLAEEVENAHERLDVLVNNAGIGGRGGKRELSEDGYELRFAVNYLATFLLTNLLMPLLRRSAPARIVNVASIGQAALDFDDLMLERSYDAFDAYRQSKLAQVMFTFELAERLGESAGVTVNCLHPATLMNTKMVFESFGSAMSTVEEGTEATLRLVASPELDGVTGRYFDQLRESRPHEQAYESEARRRLWAISEELAGIETPVV